MNLNDALVVKRALNLDGSEDQPRDEQGRWVASGSTYENKDHLKASGFEFNSAHKVWVGGTQAKDKFEAGALVGPRGKQLLIKPKGVKFETTQDYNARVKAERAAPTRSEQRAYEKEVAENKAAYEKVFGKY